MAKLRKKGYKNIRKEWHKIKSGAKNAPESFYEEKFFIILLTIVLSSLFGSIDLQSSITSFALWTSTLNASVLILLFASSFAPLSLDINKGIFKYWAVIKEWISPKLCFALRSINILKLFEFRIPYYVGPLAKKEGQSKWAWVIRKSDEKILPWTFDKVVDEDATAEKFITRMTNKCTYLINEDVMLVI